MRLSCTRAWKKHSPNSSFFHSFCGLREKERDKGREGGGRRKDPQERREGERKRGGEEERGEGGREGGREGEREGVMDEGNEKHICTYTSTCCVNGHKFMKCASFKKMKCHTIQMDM